MVSYTLAPDNTVLQDMNLELHLVLLGDCHPVICEDIDLIQDIIFNTTPHKSTGRKLFMYKWNEILLKQKNVKKGCYNSNNNLFAKYKTKSTGILYCYV